MKYLKLITQNILLIQNYFSLLYTGQYSNNSIIIPKINIINKKNKVSYYELSNQLISEVINDKLENFGLLFPISHIFNIPQGVSLHKPYARIFPEFFKKVSYNMYAIRVSNCKQHYGHRCTYHCKIKDTISSQIEQPTHKPIHCCY